MAEKRRASLEAADGHGRSKRQRIRPRTYDKLNQEYGSPSLLGFPTSVRKKIYQYLLTATESCFYIVSPGKLKSSLGWNEHELAPSLGLLRVCRSMTIETSEIIYGQTIHFHEHGVLDAWLENIGANNRNRLKHISCYFFQQCNHPPESRHVQNVTFYLHILLRAPYSKIKLTIKGAFESQCSDRFSNRTMKVSKKKIGSALQSLSRQDFIQECSRLGLIQTLLLDSQGTTAILQYQTRKPNTMLEQKFELEGYGKKNKTMGVVKKHPAAQVDVYRLKGFFDLPQDLTRRILEQAIGPPRTLEIATIERFEETTEVYNQRDSNPPRTLNVHASLPCALWACKRIRNLALRLFYTQNTFTFHYSFRKAKVAKHSFDGVLLWLSQIPHRQYAYQVRVNLDFGPNVSLSEIRISLDDLRASSIHPNAAPARPQNITCRFIAGGAVKDIHMDAVERSIEKLRYKNFCMDEDIREFCDQQEGPSILNGSYSKKEIREICKRPRYPAGCLVDGYGEARSFFIWADVGADGRVERVVRDYEFPERHSEEPRHEEQDVKLGNKAPPVWRPWETPTPI